MAYAPANDPFVITVGALDLHNSTNPDRADLAPWSAWGYTLDGFAKPELSAPGRAIVGPVPAGSTLAAREAGAGHPRARGHVHDAFRHVALGADRLGHRGRPADAPTRRSRPDQVKGALMLKARALRKVSTLAGGVGEVYAPAAAAVPSPPNPNRALDAFLVPDPAGDGMVFDDVSWLDAAKGSLTLGRGLVARRLLGRRVVVGRLLVGRLLVGRVLERRLVVGRLLGRRLLGRRLLGGRS